MTSYYWQKSEWLMNTLFPLSLLIALILLFFILVTLPYTKRKKLSLIGSLSLIIIESGLLLYCFSYSQDYRKLQVFESSVNRGIESRTFGYEDISQQKKDRLTTTDLEQTIKLPFYHYKQEKIDPLTYLGQNDYFYFFEREQFIYNVAKKKLPVSFDQTGDAMVVDFRSAVLNEPSFEEIGFYSRVGPTIFEIHLPEKDKTLNYEPTVKTYPL